MRVFLASVKLYAYDVATKVIRNFINNIFVSYTFYPRGRYSRVIRVNVKFGPTNQSKWPLFSIRYSFYFLRIRLRILFRMFYLWKNMSMWICGVGGVLVKVHFITWVGYEIRKIFHFFFGGGGELIIARNRKYRSKWFGLGLEAPFEELFKMKKLKSVKRIFLKFEIRYQVCTFYWCDSLVKRLPHKL